MRKLRFVGSESRVVLQDRFVLDVVGSEAYRTITNDNNNTTTTTGMFMTVLA
jgi:hypothetical protein